MKKIVLTIIGLVLCFCSAFADNAQELNAIRLTMKSGTVHEVCLLENPQLTFSDDNSLAIFLLHGTEYTFPLTDIANLQFFHYSDPTDVVKVFKDADTNSEKEGIYTIDGIKVNAITRPGLYIVNGKKVLINQVMQ